MASQEKVIKKLEAINSTLESDNAKLKKLADSHKLSTNHLQVRNVELRKSMSNWEGWLRKFEQLQNKLVLATTENDRLKHDLELVGQGLEAEPERHIRDLEEKLERATHRSSLGVGAGPGEGTMRNVKSNVV